MNGKFTVELKGGISYNIKPSIGDGSDRLNGIDVQDVALLRRHILGVEPLANVYQIIASDVNRNDQISTQDILLIQALILGERDSFPGDQWVFTPSAAIFQNHNNPFPFEESKNIDGNSSVGADFVAMKLGDVNGSRDNSSIGKVKTMDVTFECGYPVKNGEWIEVPVRVFGFSNISGCQFSLSWDQEKLQFNDVAQGELSASFGTSKAGEGKLQVIWDESNGKRCQSLMVMNCSGLDSEQPKLKNTSFV